MPTSKASATPQRVSPRRRSFADVVGSGVVGATDIKVVKKFMGKTLPKIRNVPKVVVGHALAREHQPVKHHHK